ncbi:MAG: hypothetical protein R3E96_15995 [Planctomycetota bacterium]
MGENEGRALAPHEPSYILAGGEFTLLETEEPHHLVIAGFSGSTPMGGFEGGPLVIDLPGYQRLSEPIVWNRVGAGVDIQKIALRREANDWGRLEVSIVGAMPQSAATGTNGAIGLKISSDGLPEGPLPLAISNEMLASGVSFSMTFR